MGRNVLFTENWGTKSPPVLLGRGRALLLPLNVEVNSKEGVGASDAIDAVHLTGFLHEIEMQCLLLRVHFKDEDLQPVPHWNVLTTGIIISQFASRAAAAADLGGYTHVLRGQLAHNASL